MEALYIWVATGRIVLKRGAINIPNSIKNYVFTEDLFAKKSHEKKWNGFLNFYTETIEHMLSAAVNGLYNEL